MKVANMLNHGWYGNAFGTEASNQCVVHIHKYINYIAGTHIRGVVKTRCVIGRRAFHAHKAESTSDTRFAQRFLKNFQKVRQLLEKICNINRQLLRRRVKF
jgi:hypothetical protein